MLCFGVIFAIFCLDHNLKESWIVQENIFEDFDIVWMINYLNSVLWWFFALMILSLFVPSNQERNSLVLKK